MTPIKLKKKIVRRATTETKQNKTKPNTYQEKSPKPLKERRSFDIQMSQISTELVLKKQSVS